MGRWEWVALDVKDWLLEPDPEGVPDWLLVAEPDADIDGVPDSVWLLVRVVVCDRVRVPECVDVPEGDRVRVGETVCEGDLETVMDKVWLRDCVSVAVSV